MKNKLNKKLKQEMMQAQYSEILSHIKIWKELESIDEHGLADYVKSILFSKYEWSMIKSHIDAFNEDQSHPWHFSFEEEKNTNGHLFFDYEVIPKSEIEELYVDNNL